MQAYNRKNSRKSNRIVRSKPTRQNPSVAHTWQFTTVRNSTYPIGEADSLCTCTLYRIDSVRHPPITPPCDTTRYAVGMNCGSEQALCLLDRIERPVDDIFDLLVRHTVTPCTLPDVLDDLSSAT